MYIQCVIWSGLPYGGLERPCRANHTTTDFGGEGTIKAQVRYNQRFRAALAKD